MNSLVFSRRFRTLKQGIKKKLQNSFIYRHFIFNYLQLLTRTNTHLENESTKFKHNAVALKFPRVNQAEWC